MVNPLGLAAGVATGAGPALSAAGLAGDPNWRGAATAQSRMRAARRLEIVVRGRDSAGRRTHTVVSAHATEQSAMIRVCEILRQWGDSHGAVPIGTRVSIVDKRDGGELFYAEYLGYEPDLLPEE